MVERPWFVNTIGGWARDIVQLLWGNVTTNDDYFLDLNERVLREVGFPCVIFAKSDYGVVAIDCNDCDTYEVDDQQISIYIKLQFRPGHAYKTKAYPFSYVPQNVRGFLEKRHELRRIYSQTPKEYRAWGRFIAVSLDRFHLAHAMHKLGLAGGCYVTCEQGYEDHALDPVKGRERMTFEEYLTHLYRASAVIDARGFGDLTHRTVEVLGIGAPLIRPKLEDQTIDPLISGVHYLDCGHEGEKLADCLEIIENHRMRQALIGNGLDWFENNCTDAALRARYSQVVDLALEKRVASNL